MTTYGMHLHMFFHIDLGRNSYSGVYWAACNRFSASSKLTTSQIALRYCLSALIASDKYTDTHIRLDILVLEVESVLPDINTDNGNKG